MCCFATRPSTVGNAAGGASYSGFRRNVNGRHDAAAGKPADLQFRFVRFQPAAAQCFLGQPGLPYVLSQLRRLEAEEVIRPGCCPVERKVFLEHGCSCCHGPRPGKGLCGVVAEAYGNGVPGAQGANPPQIRAFHGGRITADAVQHDQRQMLSPDQQVVGSVDFRTF